MSVAMYGCGPGLEELAENSGLNVETVGQTDESASGEENSQGTEESDAQGNVGDATSNALLEAINALNASLNQQASASATDSEPATDAAGEGTDANVETGTATAVDESDAEGGQGDSATTASTEPTDSTGASETPDTSGSGSSDSATPENGNGQATEGGGAAESSGDATADNKTGTETEQPDVVETADSTVDESAPDIGAAVPAPDYEIRYPKVGSKAGDVVKILSAPASKSQQQVQMTPIDNRDGHVYTVHIEPGPNGDSNDTTLRTILRQGYQDDSGKWQWKKTLIEDRTVQDKWHTAPSVAVDNNAHIHVTYNMHNTPWQYKRSASAHDIGTMNFKGQAISQAEINRWKYENKTSFPELGMAEIPGTQITYPRFEKNRDGELYVTYRFAAKPAQSFANRMMSTGIAKYDTSAKKWNAIGAPVPMKSGDYKAHPDAPDQPTVFAGKQGWTSYLPRLMFGPSNELNVQIFWREGIAGSKMSKPCYFTSVDEASFYDAKGNFVELPVQPENCNNTIYSDSEAFYTIGDVAMNSEGTPYLLFSPVNKSREIAYFDRNSKRWVKEASPSNATELFFDADDNLYAIASGIKIFRRMKGSSSWETVFSGDGTHSCFPRASLNEDKSIAYIHTHECSYTTVTVRALRLK